MQRKNSWKFSVTSLPPHLLSQFRRDTMTGNMLAHGKNWTRPQNDYFWEKSLWMIVFPLHFFPVLIFCNSNSYITSIIRNIFLGKKKKCIAFGLLQTWVWKLAAGLPLSRLCTCYCSPQGSVSSPVKNGMPPLALTGCYEWRVEAPDT